MMKKAYDIKIKDLKNILALLEDNMFDNTVVKDAILLKEYISRLKNGFNNNEQVSLIEQIMEDVECYPFYKPFYPIIEKFIFAGKDVDELDSDVKYKSILLGDIQVVHDVAEFYGQQGKLFYSQFLEYRSEIHNHLKFINRALNTDGETLFLKSIGEAFVFVPNYSNITKFTILVHEVQHVIDFYINPNFSENFLIRETIAMFMEMIAADFVAKKYNLYGENFKRQQYLHAIVKYQSHNIMYKRDALEIASEYINDKENDIFEELCKEGFDKEDIEFYFDQGITTDFSYQIAYLIAIELYMIYYKDKELALKICEDIIKNGNDDNILDILGIYGITLNSSVLKYENKIYKKRY